MSLPPPVPPPRVNAAPRRNSLEKLILARPARHRSSSLDHETNAYRSTISALGTSEPTIGVVLFDGFEMLDVFGPLEMFGVLSRFKTFTLKLIAGNSGAQAAAQDTGTLTVQADPCPHRLTFGRAPSWNGPSIVADCTVEDCPKLDILIVPGGFGTRDILVSAPALSEPAAGEAGDGAGAAGAAGDGSGAAVGAGSVAAGDDSVVVKDPALLQFVADRAAEATLVMTVCTGAALLAHAGALDGKRATTNLAAFDWVQGLRPQVCWQRGVRWVEDGKFLSSAGVSAGTDCTLHLIALLYGSDTARKIATFAEYEWKEDPKAHLSLAAHQEEPQQSGNSGPGAAAAAMSPPSHS